MLASVSRFLLFSGFIFTFFVFFPYFSFEFGSTQYSMPLQVSSILFLPLLSSSHFSSPPLRARYVVNFPHSFYKLFSPVFSPGKASPWFFSFTSTPANLFLLFHKSLSQSSESLLFLLIKKSSGNSKTDQGIITTLRGSLQVKQEAGKWENRQGGRGISRHLVMEIHWSQKAQRQNTLQ